MRTDEEFEAALHALTDESGQSRQEVVRRAVLDLYRHEVHQRRVFDAVTTLRAEWGGLLERLAHT